MCALTRPLNPLGRFVGSLFSVEGICTRTPLQDLQELKSRMNAKPKLMVWDHYFSRPDHELRHERRNPEMKEAALQSGLDNPTRTGTPRISGLYKTLRESEKLDDSHTTVKVSLQLEADRAQAGYKTPRGCIKSCTFGVRVNLTEKLDTAEAGLKTCRCKLLGGALQLEAQL
ncbi:hypothetical protein F5I97DRAFT_1827710 [Phlebopus sp. FC_14]|nr:hypothetical protein F5I97DRAFT_1827710 [Phlebopus sp. FC_14]